MKLLRLRPSAAPRRYIFTDPDTNRKFKAESREALIKAIVAYRSANGLEPIKRLEIVLDHYWATLPENIGNTEIAPKLERGWLAYVKGGLTMLDYLYYGEKKLVNQETADKRAKQCASCKYNIFPDKGPFIEWVDGIAKASVGEKATPYDDDLGNCEVCSCVNRAKVWYRGKFEPSEKEIKKFKEVDCWQLRVISNKKD